MKTEINWLEEVTLVETKIEWPIRKTLRRLILQGLKQGAIATGSFLHHTLLRGPQLQRHKSPLHVAKPIEGFRNYESHHTTIKGV